MSLRSWNHPDPTRFPVLVSLMSVLPTSLLSPYRTVQTTPQIGALLGVLSLWYHGDGGQNPASPSPPSVTQWVRSGVRGSALPASSRWRWCCQSRATGQGVGGRPEGPAAAGPPQALGCCPGTRGPWGPRAGGGTHSGCERLAAASVLAHERAPLLVEGEDVALQVEHGGVGPPTALSGTAAHVPFWGVDLHVLLQVIFALERFLAHVAHDFLW